MKNNIRSIKEGNLAKRILAVIIDGAFFAFLFFFFITMVFSKIADKSFNYSEKGAEGLLHQVNSHLYVVTEKDDNGNYKIIDTSEITDKDYKIISICDTGNEDPLYYKESIKYYYLNYKTGKDVIVPEGKDIDDYRSPDYATFSYDEAWFNNKIASFPSDKTELENYKNFASEAIDDLENSAHFKSLKKDLNLIQIFIMVPSFVISYLLIFFLPTMIFKNGETFAKKMLYLGFLTKDGYDIKKSQIVLRQLFLLLYTGIFAFVVGVELLTSTATLCFGVAIYFIATAISKTKRSFADYLAYTYLVDIRNSVWFHDPSEEEKNEKEFEEKLQQIEERKSKVEDKHVIQIGDKIVDEELAKEIENKRKK